jgi:DNA polymerase I-like protein with 3'-5' exonuclease and polymerase domains
MEALIIEESTKKQNIEQLEKWTIDEEEACTKCGGDGDDGHCIRCNGTGRLYVGRHPAAVRASEILGIKIAAKEVELYTKLLQAGRLHASFKVIGTLSSRMAGGDGLNVQGVKHAENVREMFPLAWEGYTLCNGDFDAFEVTIADAVFDDDDLHQTLLDGKKIHALLGVELYPQLSYEEIVASDGAQSPDIDYYTRSKQGMFGFLYGGDDTTWNKKLNIPADQAHKAYDKWCAKYPGIGRSRTRIQNDFCSMRQPDGIGKQVVWCEPKDYVETFLGFRRYFTLENKICKALFELANKPPVAWRNCKLQVVRRDRLQLVGGATQSALFGAAFQIQAANMRAANNHLIQSPGAQITKETQRKIWDIQPAGVNEWRVAPMNVHDEIICVTHPKYVNEVADTVETTVESFRPQVPLIGIKWGLECKNWAEKKSAESMRHITWKKQAC